MDRQSALWTLPRVKNPAPVSAVIDSQVSQQEQEEKQQLK